MANPTEPVIQTCTACGSLIDVSEEEPFSLMHCPGCGMAQRARRTFDHFEIEEVLGAGGMGAVYRALDANLNRHVALKLLRQEYSANPEFVAQFEKEAAITASISHPHVVKVFSAGSDHGLLYIAMELVDKGSLDDLMTLQGSVPEAQVLEVGIQIAKGLNAAYQRGLIHRDVKPGNILFANAHTAKIVDFGLAVLADQNTQIAGEVWGTPYYVAPEKLDNPPVEDFRSDMYSLGASLFHALCGRPPFDAETASLVALKHIKSQVVSLQAFAPNVSSATAYVINKSLAKDADARYASYDAFIEHLEYARAELLENAGKVPSPKARVVLDSAEQQKAMGWLTFGMVALIVLTGVLCYVFRDKLFGDRMATVHPAAVERAGNNSDFEPHLEAAREQILHGQYPEAVRALHQLTAKSDVPQPLLNWALLHEGTAQLLANHRTEARAVFAKIESGGPYSFDPAEQRLASFFIDLSKQLAGETRIPASASKSYDKSTYEAIGLFLSALFDWQIGAFDDAGPLFRQFQSSTPQAPHDWIAKFKDISGRYISDFTEYRGASELIKDANTTEKRKKALEMAKAALGRLELKGELQTRLEQQIKDLEQQITTGEEQQKQKATAQEDADGKVITDLKARIRPLTTNYKFSEAKSAVAGTVVNAPGAKHEKEAMMKRMEWLSTFKLLLIQDLSVTGYPDSVVKKNGQTIPGGVGRANDQQVSIQTPYGSVPLPWSDLSADTVFKMANSFLRPELPPERLADHQWCLGVFALYFGKDREGRPLLTQASQSKAEYREFLQIASETQANAAGNP